MSSDATPVTPEPEQRGSSPVVMIIVIIGGGFVFLACAGVLVALLLPAVQAAREAARRSACRNNLRMISIALQNYELTHGTLPPPFIAGADGQPMHSWRVLVLPFFEDGETTKLYEQYDFDEPWDGPHNRRLAAQMPRYFRCPSSDDSDSQTNYVAVVGDDTMWPTTGTVTLEDISKGDGTPNTIAVVETTDSGINWMEPRDLTLDEATGRIDPQTGPGMSSPHHFGVNVLMADGGVQFLDNSVPPDVLRAMFTVNGGERIDPHALGY